VNAVAVSDDGKSVLLGSSDGEAGAVSLVTVDGGPRMLAAVGVPAAIRFISQTNDAVVADSKQNQVFLIKGVTGALTMLPLASETLGASGPIDLDFSSDLRKLYVANAGANNLLVIEIASAIISSVECAFRPSHVARMPRSPGLLVALSETESAWMIETSVFSPRASFIPVLPLTLTGGQTE
jgi:DNA-binding beta-propeller fold protein YncE